MAKNKIKTHPKKTQTKNDERMKNTTIPQHNVLKKRKKTKQVEQLVTCLTTNTRLNADPGVASAITAPSHTFLEIDHEIVSTAILPPSADSSGVVVSYKRKFVHEVLVNCLVKLAQEKVWFGELTVPT